MNDILNPLASIILASTCRPKFNSPGPVHLKTLAMSWFSHALMEGNDTFYFFISSYQESCQRTSWELWGLKG